jgi:hypothetical protein
VPAKKTNAPAQKATGPTSFGPTITPNGGVVSLKAPDDATLDVETEAIVCPRPLSVSLRREVFRRPRKVNDLPCPT